MITPAPLPRWIDLLAALGPATVRDDALAEPWRRDGETVAWFARAAWAFAALARAEQARRERTDIAVWLPGYFCNQSTVPLRDTGAKVGFYPLTEDLQPDWAACRARAADAPPALFVLVHVFGAPADAAAAVAFCHAVDARLVEDAAHVLRPTPGVGAAGDAVVYSPGKVLAVPDGGLLLTGRTWTGDRPPAPTGPAPAPWPWLARRTVQTIMPSGALAARARTAAPPFDADPPSLRLPDRPALSALSRRLLARAGHRLATVAAERRDNADRVTEALAPVGGWRRLAADADAPYRLVLRFDEPARAAALYARWRRAGFPVETWPDLPPEVLADPTTHAAAIALRRSVLLLPVHRLPRPADFRALVG